MLAVVLPPEEAGLLAGAEPEEVEPALAGPEVGVLAGLAAAELAGLADDVEAETGRAAFALLAVTPAVTV